MKRALFILMLTGGMLRASAQLSQLPLTNELDITFDATSYDLEPLLVLGPILATWIINEDPAHTNSFNSVSRSGASWQNQFENQQPEYCPAFWCYAFYTNHVIPFDLMLANDNGDYTSNSANQWGTNLFGAPDLMWNNTAKTNEGFTGLKVAHLTIGANVGDASNGGATAIARNRACTNLNATYGFVPVNLWEDTWTNAWSTDVIGARILGFDKYGGGHANASGFFFEALSIGRQIGLMTNFGSITFDFQGASVSASNGFAAVSLSSAGTSFSCTLKADRMPPSWDRAGIISSDVTEDIWLAAPGFGNVLRWTITVTNFPQPGNYAAFLDGVLWDTATDVQWTAGRNEATNTAPNVAFNLQRDQTLHDVLDKYGVDYITRINTHGAGETGAHGLNDLIRYQSHTGGAFPASHGPSLVNLVGQDIVDHRAFDVIANGHAQQTPHTLTMKLIPTRFVFHR